MILYDSMTSRYRRKRYTDANDGNALWCKSTKAGTCQFHADVRLNSTRLSLRLGGARIDPRQDHLSALHATRIWESGPHIGKSPIAKHPKSEWLAVQAGAPVAVIAATQWLSKHEAEASMIGRAVTASPPKCLDGFTGRAVMKLLSRTRRRSSGQWVD